MGMVFALFWSENVCRVRPFWSGISYGFRGNDWSVLTYLLFQFQMNKKERVIWELKIDFKKSFYWRSNLSNLDTIT